MQSIYSITYSKLVLTLEQNGFKKFRAEQIFEWVYQKRVKSFEEMSNINSDLKIFLNINFYFNELKIVTKNEDIDVKKVLFELSDSNRIESVLMYQNYGQSLCVSSQVGCNMGCTFCESGRLKKIKNLSVDEMVLQLFHFEEKITHVVLMGIGEPLDNFENVMDFINIMTDYRAFNIGSRHITVSTCGIVDKIEQLPKYNNQINLAISLHAPNNELRSSLMPINKVYPLENLIKALNEYIKATNRRVTFEYVMIRGINDQLSHAKELSHLIKGMNAYVNLIPYNETSHIEFKKSEKTTILQFYDILKKNKINVTIRKEFGNKVKAACGQLRSNYEDTNG
jgi:23S rRNA (adenine2503-C2)-methyltransferase